MTKQLITISDNAAKRIKEILSNAESGVKGVRVMISDGMTARSSEIEVLDVAQRLLQSVKPGNPAQDAGASN